MGSRASQGVKVLAQKKRDKGQLLLVTKKTGFVDVTINGKQYYYDEKQEWKTINELNLREAFGGTTSANKKGTIVVTKK